MERKNYHKRLSKRSKSIRVILWTSWTFSSKLERARREKLVGFMENPKPTKENVFFLFPCLSFRPTKQSRKVKVLNLIVLLLLFDNLIVITMREGKFET